MYDGEQRRAIVRTDTKKMAAEMFDVTIGELNNYFSVTGNVTENAVLGVVGPNKVMVSTKLDNKEFVPLPYTFRNVRPQKIPKLSDLILTKEYEIACKMRANNEFYHDFYNEYIDRLRAEMEKRGIIS